MEVKELNNSQRQEISQAVHDWKKVMGVIPSYQFRGLNRFTQNDIDTLEQEVKSGTYATGMLGLLAEWESMGRSRQPNLKDLLKHLLQADELAAASYISETLLKEVPITEENKREKLDELKHVAIIDCNIDELNTYDRLLEEDDFVAPDPDESAVFSSPLARENDLCAPKISFHYLLDITHKFQQSNQIGEGGFSQVFQGITHRRKIRVAVKKLRHDKVDDVMQINHEVDHLPRLKHENIIDLLAYCNESKDRLCLVYPYMENGSLKQRLDEKDLNFEQKRKIIVGVAKGINHMHTRQKPLVHRDIKPGNILLDECFYPKIADFDLLRYGTSGEYTAVSMTGREAGTALYMPTEARNGSVTAKMDVWAYGIVLLEIITGLKALDPSRDQVDLVSHFKFELEDIKEPEEQKRIFAEEFLEPPFTRDDLDITLLEIVKGCLKENHRRRWSMKDVLQKLNCIELY